MHILFFWFSKTASIASNDNVSPAGNNRLLERLLLSDTVWGSCMSPAWTGLGHGAFCFSYHAMSLMIGFKHLIYHAPFYKQIGTWKCFPYLIYNGNYTHLKCLMLTYSSSWTMTNIQFWKYWLLLKIPWNGYGRMCWFNPKYYRGHLIPWQLHNFLSATCDDLTGTAKGSA